MAHPRPKLRIVTYMCPSHPVELYELIMQYLEEEIGCEASLLYESRGPGPLPDRVDPFTDNSVDMGFLTASAYVKLLDTQNKYAELLPVTAVFEHPKNTEGVKGYYSDVITHVDGRKHVKEFLDLRGCRWAYSDKNSLSASTVILKTLKELGENSSFFGNTSRSGSHLNSIHMVLTKQAEAAAIDANTLACNKKYLQDGGKDIKVLYSIGPLPPYPIVVNNRLNRLLKEDILQALLKMHQTRLWESRLNKFGLLKFVPNNKDNYQEERDIQDAVKNVSLDTRYY